MKDLEYPFDSGWILSNRRKIKKRLLTTGNIFVEKKVAVLGGSTTSNIIQILELFLLNQGIKASFYESEYGMYYEDAVFKNDSLEEFGPDIIYIYTTNRNIESYPLLSNTREEIDALINMQIQKFTDIWKSLSQTYACPIIQNNFEMPLFRLLGNKDATDVHGAVNFLSRLNMAFYEYAQNNKDFFICDINYISADYGLKEWNDSFYWHMYKYAVNVRAIPLLAFNVANIIKSIFGKNKKGLVLDLDNTLWGGIIGDDGVDNIKLGPETAAGQVYLEFQQYIKAQKQLGIVLNIDSKNDEGNALSGLKHPDSVLSVDDFTKIRANWEPKDRNFDEIACELNLLPESLVFIDDNPAERYIVTKQLPGICAPEIGESHQYITIIDRNGFFETTYLSEDDIKRNKMYQDNARRATFQASFSDYESYLESLKMKATIKPFEAIYLERIVQLINKSNQFNLTTKRYSQREIKEILDNDDYITIYGKLEDKFGDNGVVSVCIGHKKGKLCNIDLWVMSCRVLKRNMEYAMMDMLVDKCKKAGVKKIVGYYYSTEKNSMVKEFYGTMGFNKIDDSEEGSCWEFIVDNSYIRKNKHIQLEAE